MNWLGLVFVLFGLSCVMAAALDRHSFMEQRKARIFVNVFGRFGARIVYVLFGTAFIVFGILIMLGIFKDRA